MAMASQRNVEYKWDPQTSSGYRLRYDAKYPRRGLRRRYVVENWENQTIVEDWGCNTVEEAVGVLDSLFEVDRQVEIKAIKQRFEP